MRATDLRAVMKISGLAAARTVAPSIGAAFEAAGVQSMIVAPIRQQDESLGILAAFFHHPRAFDEQASPLADALAGQAARAIFALRLQQRLEHAAMHDEITGLPNRRLLEESMAVTRRTTDTVAGVLFIDLDGFKTVNDTFGHHAGDDLLSEVADRIQSKVREQDTVARYGGDEFVVICDVADQHEAVDMAERIRRTIRAPYDTLPVGKSIAASIGVSVASVRSIPQGVDELVLAADQAMYRAKYAGGDQIVVAPIDRPQSHF